jgi:hypothetical protein
MSAAALLFWCVAAAKVLLSAPIQIRAAQARTPERLREARGQRKDDWLAMVVMVLALLSDSYPLTGWAYLQIREAMGQPSGQTPNLAGWVYLVGTATLAWLVQRSLRRLGTPSHR